MAEAQYLPEHIIQQIFLRMPTKPLVQLKCLSKHWNRVISDPKFIKSRSRRAILLPSLPFHAIDSRDQSMFKLVSSVINLETYRKFKIVGSFKGIFLLVLTYRDPDPFRNDRHMILYNPLLGEFKTVPDPPSFRHLFDSHSQYVYGFGYATNEDDLKIVGLKGDSKSYEVFSLKSWSWSTPSEITGDYSFYTHYSGTFANGFLYWNAKKRNCSDLIVALDLKKMEFSEIELPDLYRLSCLGTYNGQLCMICRIWVDTTFGSGVGWYELRVINEHAFGKSCLVCRFGSSSGMLKIFYFSPSNELCILDDGKLLVKLSERLFIYDMLKDSYNEVNVLTNFYRAGKLQCVEYVESLIPPSDICNV